MSKTKQNKNKQKKKNKRKEGKKPKQDFDSVFGGCRCGTLGLPRSVVEKTRPQNKEWPQGKREKV